MPFSLLKVGRNTICLLTGKDIWCLIVSGDKSNLINCTDKLQTMDFFSISLLIVSKNLNFNNSMRQSRSCQAIGVPGKKYLHWSLPFSYSYERKLKKERNSKLQTKRLNQNQAGHCQRVVFLNNKLSYTIFYT